MRAALADWDALLQSGALFRDPALRYEPAGEDTYRILWNVIIREAAKNPGMFGRVTPVSFYKFMGSRRAKNLDWTNTGADPRHTLSKGSLTLWGRLFASGEHNFTNAAFTNVDANTARFNDPNQ